MECPRCGDTEHYPVEPTDDVGTCLVCGFHYYVVETRLSLEDVNEARSVYDLEPLTELKQQRR